mmetsp:Transcript_15384/g.43603  ORF Transcript_15384/g.43603 Transcript_15384/m.43603 type:complete len:100 (-) Transcript_15384:179-478(-)
MGTLQRRAGLMGLAISAFAGTECAVNSFLGEPKWEGNIAGGLAAGSILSLAKGSPVLGLTVGVTIGGMTLLLDKADGYVAPSATLDAQRRINLGASAKE